MYVCHASRSVVGKIDGKESANERANEGAGEREERVENGTRKVEGSVGRVLCYFRKADLARQ